MIRSIVLLSVFLIAFSVALPAQERGLAADVTEEFDQLQLGKRWQWVREDRSHWNLKQSPGRLTLTTAPGELGGKDNDGRNLLLTETAAPDFEVEIKLDFDPVFNIQQAGLIAYKDDANFAQLLYKFERQKILELGGQARGVYTRQVKPAAGGPNETGRIRYLRLRKAGNTYTGAVSRDGTAFAEIGRCTVDLGASPKVGVYAANAGGVRYATEIPARIDYFRIYYPKAKTGLADKTPAPTVPPVKLEPENDAAAVDPAAATGGVEQASTTETAPRFTKIGFEDEFSGTALDPRWQWVRESPGRWKLNPGSSGLSITTETGNLRQGWTGNFSNDNKNMLLTEAVNSDYEIEMKCVFGNIQAGQTIGVLVYHDDDNYIGLYVESVSGAACRFELGPEIDGAFAPPAYRETGYVRQFSLRLRKEGDSYLGFYSLDGKTYHAVGEVKTNLAGKPRIGLYAYHTYLTGNEQIKIDRFSVAYRDESAPNK